MAFMILSGFSISSGILSTFNEKGNLLSPKLFFALHSYEIEVSIFTDFMINLYSISVSDLLICIISCYKMSKYSLY